ADRVAEALHRAPVGLVDDLAQHLAGLGLGVAGDDESVEAEAHRAPGPGGVRADLLDLLGEAVEVLAVGEVPGVAGPCDAAGGGGVTVDEALAEAPAGLVQRLVLEVVAWQPVEVADVVAGGALPGGADVGDELLGAPVALVVLQPRLAERGELA